MREPRSLEPVLKGIAEHAKQQGARSVKTVRLKIGQYLNLEEGAVRESFVTLTKATLLEGARLELTYFPAYRIEVVSFDIE